MQDGVSHEVQQDLNKSSSDEDRSFNNTSGHKGVNKRRIESDSSESDQSDGDRKSKRGRKFQKTNDLSKVKSSNKATKKVQKYGC